jgi:hypothetical protein
MMRKFLPILGFGLLATFALVVALIAAPDRRGLLLDLYLVALGGIAVVRLVGLTRKKLEPGERSEFEEALRVVRSTPVRIAERDKLEREIELGTQTAFDFHFRLRPTLIEIARNQLAARGLSLEKDARSQTILGPETWELLRPERPLPNDRNARGLAKEELGRVVDSLERISR